VSSEGEANLGKTDSASWHSDSPCTVQDEAQSHRMTGKLDKDSWFSVEDKLPPSGELLRVDCTRFRCLGYLDENGIWRGAVKHEKLEQVVGWQRVKG